MANRTSPITHALSAAALTAAAVGLTGCGEPTGAAAAQVRTGPAEERSGHPDRAQYAATLDGVRAAYAVVLQNLAHAQTPGYRAVRPIFEPVASDGPAGRTKTVLQPVMVLDPSPGRPVETGRWLDVAVRGAGYLILDDPDGGGVDGLSYSRAGRLYVNADHRLVQGSPDGPPVEPFVTFPDDYRDLKIDPDGTVRVLPVDTPARWVAVGRLHLARFASEIALRPVGPGRYAATPESGPPLVDHPGHLGLGTLEQKHLEGSNVSTGDELAELDRLRTWGEALASGLGVDPDFADSPDAAWAAGPAPGTNPGPAPTDRLTAQQR
ncbi:MAG: flagellar hook basal-body protein [Planctomycetota bacterium]